MLLVIGAAGTIGRHVVHELSAANQPMRAIVPSRARISPAEFGTAELALGDPGDRAVLDAALQDISGVIMITRVDPHQVALEQHVVSALQRHGIRRLVKLSSSGAAPDAPFRVGRWHWQTERLLAATDLDWTIVRAHRPMQYVYSHLGSVLAQHTMYGCQGDGRSADIDLRDVAAVLATVAARDTHIRETLTVTGPEALSAAETAAALGRHMGHPVVYVDCTPTDFVRAQMASGLPRWQAEDRAAWQRAVRDGWLGEPTETVSRIIGRAARGHEAFAAEFAAAVQYARGPGAREGATREPVRYATPT